MCDTYKACTTYALAIFVKIQWGVEEKQMELANLEIKLNDLNEELDKDQFKLKSE